MVKRAQRWKKSGNWKGKREALGIRNERGVALRRSLGEACRYGDEMIVLCCSGLALPTCGTDGHLGCW